MIYMMWYNMLDMICYDIISITEWMRTALLQYIVSPRTFILNKKKIPILWPTTTYTHIIHAPTLLCHRLSWHGLWKSYKLILHSHQIYEVLIFRIRISIQPIMDGNTSLMTSLLSLFTPWSVDDVVSIFFVEWFWRKLCPIFFI